MEKKRKFRVVFSDQLCHAHDNCLFRDRCISKQSDAKETATAHLAPKKRKIDIFSNCRFEKKHRDAL